MPTPAARHRQLHEAVRFAMPHGTPSSYRAAHAVGRGDQRLRVADPEMDLRRADRGRVGIGALGLPAIMRESMDGFAN
jgi:hypothetical protein